MDPVGGLGLGRTSMCCLVNRAAASYLPYVGRVARLPDSASRMPQCIRSRGGALQEMIRTNIAAMARVMEASPLMPVKLLEARVSRPALGTMLC